MIHLIHIEILKLRRNPSFLILLALFVLSVVGVNYVAAEIVNGNKELEKVIKFTFPEVWKSVAYIASYVLVIPGLMVIMHTCAEYTYRTHRQNIIDGLSRDQYITAKVLFVLGLALFSSGVTFVVAWFIGSLSGAPFSFEGCKYMGYFFIHAVMFLGLALLFALFLKRSAITIGIFVTYWLVIENVAEKYLCKLDDFGQLVPLGSSEHLLALDAYRIVSLVHLMPERFYLSAAVVYIVACYAACYCRYRKQNL
ncbi:MAG: ABC transporter permease [Odoribacteraceae bacterium]|jgi:ABC-type transport system involved in multi-copper enzyme maturation permease subunit|nr:ABC transporter permease [Odoribacteraceae bacterium]